MQHDPKLLSVIIPAYKQSKSIEQDIRQIDASLVHIKIPYELIVVVDGKEDQTYARARKLVRKHIVVVGYEHNHGKGYAVRYGMARAKGDVIAFLDAGSDIRAEGVSMFLEHYRWYNADIIIGSKRHPVSKVHYPFSRTLLSWGYQMVVRVMFGLNIRDSQVGMKLFRRKVLEDVLPRLLVKEFAFDIEILAVAHHLGYRRIFEAPVELDFSGASSITSANLWNIIYHMLWDTAAVFYRLKILRYYDNLNSQQWRYDPELNFRINIG
ncbi:glycosyltransferase [Candidatus Gottesmanbacteria bacterium]|nr:glycosyltransferase [Candidatus Gottesmanbacteria bacterium]